MTETTTENELKFSRNGKRRYGLEKHVYKHGLPMENPPALTPVHIPISCGAYEYSGVLDGSKFYLAIGIMGFTVRAETKETADAVARALKRYKPDYK
jgi:hypothetical protein